MESFNENINLFELQTKPYLLRLGFGQFKLKKSFVSIFMNIHLSLITKS